MRLTKDYRGYSILLNNTKGDGKIPNRSMSLGILLFVFGLVMFGFKPPEGGWNVYFDMQYYVPIVEMPLIAYWITGAVAFGLSILFVAVSFRKKWSENAATFVMKKAHYPLFVMSYLLYAISYINAVGEVISLSPAVWVGTLAFYYGFILLILIPISYFREIPKHIKGTQ